MRVVKKMVVTPARSLQNDDLVAEYGEVFFFLRGKTHSSSHNPQEVCKSQEL